jgi:hypothetical protein
LINPANYIKSWLIFLKNIMYYNIWLIFFFFKRVEWRVEDACEWGLSKWSVSLCRGFVQGKWKSTEESVEMTFLSSIDAHKLLLLPSCTRHYWLKSSWTWTHDSVVAIFLFIIFLRIYFQRGSSINDGFSSPKWFFSHQLFLL